MVASPITPCEGHCLAVSCKLRVCEKATMVASHHSWLLQLASMGHVSARGAPGCARGTCTPSRAGAAPPRTRPCRTCAAAASFSFVSGAHALQRSALLNASPRLYFPSAFEVPQPSLLDFLTTPVTCPCGADWQLHPRGQYTLVCGDIQEH